MVATRIRCGHAVLENHISAQTTCKAPRRPSMCGDKMDPKTMINPSLIDS